MLFFTIYALILTSLLPFTCAISAPSLYNPEDPLWELDSSNFYREVLGKNKVWIVEFYKHWCGYCIRYSPTWKEFARDTRTWRDVMDVAVVNCADPININLCREYEITTVPHIKLFRPNANGNYKGELISGDRDITTVLHTVVKFLESNSNAIVAQTWPNLFPVTVPDVKSLLNLIPKSEDSLLLYIESPTSFVGREIILDLSFKKGITVRRALSTNTALLNDMQIGKGQSTFPQLLKISRSGEEETLFRFKDSMNSTYIRDQVFEHIVGQPRNKDTPIDIVDPIDRNVTTTNAVYRTDLQNAARYALTLEVPTHNSISGLKLLALKTFVSYLNKYFPGESTDNRYLAKVNNWLASKKNDVTGTWFMKALDRLQNKNEFLPEMREWVGCKGSEPQFRGYPCSMWTLFHTLTVQASVMEETSSATTENEGLKVLLAIQGYVKYFFSCEQCALHFGEMAKTIKDKVTTSRDAVLWLWDAHNQVNRRLAGDATEDPHHPKVQFPSENMCSRCRISSAKGEVQFDKSLVYRYLQHFYRSESILDATQEAPSAHSVNKRSINVHNSARGKENNLSTPVSNLILWLRNSFDYFSIL